MQPSLFFGVVVFFLTIFTGVLYSANPMTSSQTEQTQPLTKEVLDKALQASTQQSKIIHNDALRVWKSFKIGRKPNYSYYYWGRKIVFWLKKNESIAFDSRHLVKNVFVILKDQDLISEDAVEELTRFVWESLQRRRDLPTDQRAMPDYRIEKKHITEEQLSEEKTPNAK